MSAVDLKGMVRRILYRSGMFVVAVLDQPGHEDGQDAVVVGEARGTALQVGGSYTFFGEWSHNHKHGWRFKFSTFSFNIPPDRNGIELFLAKEIDGIGARLAVKLCDAYGDDVINVLSNDYGRAVSDGILSSEVARNASQSINENRVRATTLAELYSFLVGKGFPTAFYNQIWTRFRAEGPMLIRQNPFILLEERITGCGFKRADQVWMDLGHDHLSPIRAMWCAWNCIDSDTSGHTWVQFPQLVKAVQSYMGLSIDAEAAINAAESMRLLAFRDTPTMRLVATYQHAMTEASLARNIIRLSSFPGKYWPNPKLLKLLNEHQQEELSKGLHSAIAILTGTPGTGKTWCAGCVVNGVVQQDIVKNKGRHVRVAACAPTGKAAVRLTEVLRGEPHHLEVHATTIHKLLVPKPCPTGWVFEHNREEPLPYDVIICDELSMADISLLDSLLSACADGTHILFLGDCNQLPPVGNGAPLRDMLAAGVASSRLTKVIRNSGTIVSVCKELVNRRRFPLCNDYSENSNLRFVPVASPIEIRTCIAKLIAMARSRSGIDPVMDIQIMAAINNKTSVSCKPMNIFLQDILNQEGRTFPDIVYRVGDKIICTANGYQPRAVFSGDFIGEGIIDPQDAKNYDSSISPDGERETAYVANGEIGRVVAVSPTTVVADFSLGNPDRDGYDLRRVWITPPRGEEDEEASFGLAYCVTAHKMQGAEVPIALLIVDESPNAAMVASVELVYTAISRAKMLCYVVGKRAVLDKWVQRSVLSLRRTCLADLLREGLRGTLGLPHLPAETNIDGQG